MNDPRSARSGPHQKKNALTHARRAKLHAFHQEIGKILSDMRKKRGKTQADLNVPQRTVRRIEKGQLQRSTALALFHEMRPCSREALRWMRAMLNLLAPGCLRCDPDCGMCDTSVAELARELRKHTGLEEFAMERAMLKNIVELNPYAIVIFDEEGRFVRANDAYLKLFKQPPPEGVTLFDSAPLKKAGVQEKFLKLKEGHLVELPPIWHNSREVGDEWPDNPICIGTVAFPLCDRDGNIRNFVCMSEDVTQHMLAEKRLQKALRFKSDFTKTISHELSEPLRAITANAKALMNESKTNLTGQQKERIERIVGNAQHIMHALNGLVELKRTYDGNPQVTAEYFFLQDILKASVASFNTIAADTVPHIALEMEENLPIIYNDRQKISHIIASLLGNALQSAKGGEIKISAGISMECDDRVRIAVSDAGGMRVPKAANAQGAPTSVTPQLELVHTFAGLVGGEIRLEDEAEEKSIAVTLPLSLPFQA